MRETTAYLRRFIGCDIREVRDLPDGIAIHIGVVGHMSRRLLVFVGVTEIHEMIVLPPHTGWAEDDAQAQTDIGDEMYERERYDERDIDVEPGREQRTPRKEQP